MPASNPELNLWSRFVTEVLILNELISDPDFASKAAALDRKSPKLNLLLVEVIQSVPDLTKLLLDLVPEYGMQIEYQIGSRAEMSHLSPDRLSLRLREQMCFYKLGQLMEKYNFTHAELAEDMTVVKFSGNAERDIALLTAKSYINVAIQIRMTLVSPTR